MTLKEQIKLALGIPENHFDNHNSDLLVLTTLPSIVMDWLVKNYEFSNSVKIFTSNVEGQKWFGKQVIEIPFGYEEYFKNKAKA